MQLAPGIGRCKYLSLSLPHSLQHPSFGEQQQQQQQQQLLSQGWSQTTHLLTGGQQGDLLLLLPPSPAGRPVAGKRPSKPLSASLSHPLQVKMKKGHKPRRGGKKKQRKEPLKEKGSQHKHHLVSRAGAICFISALLEVLLVYAETFAEVV